ncbi:hypothetical protein [Microbacterium aurantiacum]|uniref:F5/8 type C domain-containing protein n=1 Tax=Microbacterium aurantiacum TaxID=162393 RepID=A0ABT8FRI2_9MICO|nr:hypothetical protein [Microbacterium aurantiacum]MDN4463921.1 hypothetical protein [Microbacterium aurantiacum]
MPEIAEVKTIGEVERIVHASGLWNGTTAVEFSNDGETWREAWSPSDEHPSPEFARVTVHRKDVAVPTTVTIRWDEQRPRENDEWAEKWDGAPTRHFGRTVRMVAFRQTFRDILGDIQLPDEERGGAAPGDAAPARDWAAEIEAATTVEAIDALDGEARQARVFTPDAAGTALHRQLKAKRKQLVDGAWDPRETVTPVESERPRPQDRLPAAGNRAARRSASRKKGRRR